MNAIKALGDEVSTINDAMHAFVREHLPEGDWSVPVEADRLYRLLPDDLLADWLSANGRKFLSLLIADLRLSDRRSTMQLRAFAKRASTFAKYQEGMASVFDMHFVVNDEYLSRRLGDMTRADLTYVRDRFTGLADDLALKAAFLDDLRKRTPEGQTVEEAMQENTVRNVLAKYFQPA